MNYILYNCSSLLSFPDISKWKKFENKNKKEIGSLYNSLNNNISFSENINDFKSQKLSSDFSSVQNFSDKTKLKPYKTNNDFDNNSQELEEFYYNFYN